MTTTEVGKAFLGLRKYFCEIQNKRLTALQYDVACEGIEDLEQKLLYYMFVFESLDCFTADELKDVVSRAKRVSANCGSCSVSDAEIAAWLLTAEGIYITDKI
jgi:hypothetical protein